MNRLNGFIHLLLFSFFLPRLRQNLREKHSRHVADLKAYYESEIQILRDKLKLRDLPQDLERSNQALAERCALIHFISFDAFMNIPESNIVI